MKNTGGLPLACVAFAVFSCAFAGTDYPFRAAEMTDVAVRSGFWLPRIETNRLVTIRSDFKRSEETGRIHALGMKAGTYSDAGENTCASYGGDKSGIGAGLYGHDAEDCRLHFNELGFDFVKVDYCGALHQHLEEKKRYSEIAAAIKATGRKDVRLNICRWAFPGTWAADIAGSWRTNLHDYIPRSAQIMNLL